MTAPRETGGAPLAIAMRDISKSFGAVRANRGASLEVPAGEIHALVGENGAGKSTLMRILSGMYPPDAGTILVDGRDVTGWSTAEAIDAGLGMVHQHFMLVPTLTVAENVVLGREPGGKFGAFDRAGANRAVRDLSANSGLRVPPDQLVSDLSVGEAQRVEILKTLYRGAKILVLDEPTAVLSPPEVQELWSVLRTLRANGGTIVIITHKLDEVMDISDAITVMRQGETVARMRTADTTPAQIAKAMVGRDVGLASWKEPAASTSARTAALDVRDLVVMSARGTKAVDGVSFSVAAGEILGIAGVEGNGQTELLEAIAGLRPVTAGTITLGGASNAKDVTRETVRGRSDGGLSHIPEDRHQRGLILDYPISDNLILGQQHQYTSGLMVARDRVAANAREKVESFDIRPRVPSLPARALSGGNQQKVVIAREMGRPFTVLLAAQPTRGVDVGAIEFIHDRLRAARADGKAVLLVSADLSEVLALSDRIAVMYGGKIVAVLSRAEANEEILGEYMTGLAGAGAERHE